MRRNRARGRVKRGGKGEIEAEREPIEVVAGNLGVALLGTAAARLALTAVLKPKLLKYNTK